LLHDGPFTGYFAINLFGGRTTTGHVMIAPTAVRLEETPSLLMPNRHRPGYVAPSEKQLRHYVVQLRPETLAAWREAAARAGISQRQATEYVYRKFAREQGVDVRSHPGPNGSKPPALDC
jgi:hypothetical protein